MSIKITGQSTVLANIKKAMNKMEDNSETALTNLGNKILRESRDESPFDVGTLMKTSKMTKTGKLERTLSYNTPYAVRMHEHPEYNFQNGRKGKYLEDPLKANTSSAVSFLKKFIKL